MGTTIYEIVEKLEEEGYETVTLWTNPYYDPLIHGPGTVLEESFFFGKCPICDEEMEFLGEDHDDTGHWFYKCDNCKLVIHFDPLEDPEDSFELVVELRRERKRER